MDSASFSLKFVIEQTDPSPEKKKSGRNPKIKHQGVYCFHLWPQWMHLGPTGQKVRPVRPGSHLGQKCPDIEKNGGVREILGSNISSYGDYPGLPCKLRDPFPGQVRLPYNGRIRGRHLT